MTKQFFTDTFLSVLEVHDVVEEGVEGGGEEVQATGQVKQVLVHSTEVRRFLSGLNLLLFFRSLDTYSSVRGRP